MNSGLRQKGPKDFITVVSTATIDEVPRPDGTVEGRPGGPATYIGAALLRLEVPYRLITGARPTVRVMLGDGGEQYIIPAIPRIELPERISGRATIISPIIGEVDPDHIPPVEGLLAVDIQGFVREPGVPTNSVARQFDLRGLIGRAEVVKAGHREIELLDRESRRALAGRIVIETRGADGAIIKVGRTETAVRGETVRGADTIGAGDTFLAAFVVRLLAGDVAARAGMAAAQFTSHWLGERASAG